VTRPAGVQQRLTGFDLDQEVDERDPTR
jgi:hypothetical protein